MQPPRGMHDLLPEVYKIHDYIVNSAREVSARYGFEPIETPLVEDVDLFCRSLGDVSDIVSKEMYELVQKGSDRLVIRPEGTAGVARAVISNGLTQSLPLKYIYWGPMMRYERPQKGRLRLFHQIGVEYLGDAGGVADAEVIVLGHDFLKKLGISDRVTLEINTLGDTESRLKYRDALVSYLCGYKDKLSEDSKIRLEKNPLRILDSKDERDREILQNAPILWDYLNDESKQMFAEVKNSLESVGIPFKVNPLLVRGLDYYCHTAFEFTTTELGAQATVLAGGRYDGLVEMLGGPRIPAVGWACGIERIAMMVGDMASNEKIIAMLIGESELNPLGLKICNDLRSHGFRVERVVGNDRLGKQLKKASKLNANYAVIIGTEEANNDSITIKNMESGEQVTIGVGSMIDYFKQVLK